MKRTILGAMALAIFLAGCSQQPPPPSKINWLTSYDEAVAAAKAQSKPLLIDFYADWCGPCKLMDRETYQDDALVSELTNNWIVVKIDVDKNQTLAQKYQVTGIPATFLLTKEAKAITNIVGFIDAKELRGALNASGGALR